MGRKVGSDRGKRPPAILDPATRPVLIGERAIERLVIQQRVSRPGRAAEAAAFDENLVCAAFEVIRLVVLGKTRGHRRADAGPDKDIERYTAFAKRLGDAGMRGPETAAAGRHESDRSPRQKTDQAVDVDLVLERYMVMHEAGQARKPRRGAADFPGSVVMNAHDPSRRRRMHLAGECLDLGQGFQGGVAVAREYN